MAGDNLNILFARVRNGDREAFEHIYNQLKQPVFTICWRIIQSRETAEDLTHDVFVKLYISPPDTSVKNPRAWAFKMARNLAIDALRKKGHTEIDEIQIIADDTYRQIHMKMDVESALSQLPCMEREIVSLHLNGGLNFSEISRIVDLSLPATYRRYRKALTTIKHQLNGGKL